MDIHGHPWTGKSLVKKMSLQGDPSTCQTPDPSFCEGEPFVKLCWYDHFWDLAFKPGTTKMLTMPTQQQVPQQTGDVLRTLHEELNMSMYRYR